MQTLTIQLPDRLDVPENWDARMFLAAKLFEERILTSGQAAESVGISKREFLETVGKYGVSVFGQTSIEEVLEDLANA